MNPPIIYYKASFDYLFPDGTALQFPFPHVYPFNIGDPEFSTHRMRSLSGRLRTSQIHNGHYRLSLQFQYFTDSFKAAYLSFINTVRGSLYPFYFYSSDGVLFLVHLMEDYNPIDAFMADLNQTQMLEMEGRNADIHPPIYAMKLDPDGSVETDPDDNPILVPT